MRVNLSMFDGGAISRWGVTRMTKVLPRCRCSVPPRRPSLRRSPWMNYGGTRLRQNARDAQSASTDASRRQSGFCSRWTVCCSVLRSRLHHYPSVVPIMQAVLRLFSVSGNVCACVCMCRVCGRAHDDDVFPPFTTGESLK
ncbi:hypothetical protein, unknown function [Leishmania tarentolae]|uniref:Uncharacterized protein n=1 Tax=Leishmania tarentolae TaxID=5689 RepID=A0A640K7G7_LEITA|nr:hypothetical protein, unknown function [Leishmania tarentolae]